MYVCIHLYIRAYVGTHVCIDGYMWNIRWPWSCQRWNPEVCVTGKLEPLRSHSCCFPSLLLPRCLISGTIRNAARGGWGNTWETCACRRACCRTPWSTTTWLWSCSEASMTSSGLEVRPDVERRKNLFSSIHLECAGNASFFFFFPAPPDRWLSAGLAWRATVASSRPGVAHLRKMIQPRKCFFKKIF